MSTALLALIICFVFLLIIGFPIALNLIFSSFIYLLVGDYPLTLIPQRMFQGMNGFALLAVPFFILTGQLMAKGSILRDLTDFVNAFVGHVRGALALVTVGTCLFMGAIVGLAVAETASLGSFLIPMMKKEGYKPAFASGVMASASLLGPIMPPSVLMILYCISVGRTSIAGSSLPPSSRPFSSRSAQMLVIYFIARRDKLPRHERIAWPDGAAVQEGTARPVPAGHHPGRHLRGHLHRDRGLSGRCGLCLRHLHVLCKRCQVARSSRHLHGNGGHLRPCHPACRERHGDGLGHRQRAGRRHPGRRARELPAVGLPPPAEHRPFDQRHVHGRLRLGHRAGPDPGSNRLGPGRGPLQIGVIICVNLVIGLATPPFGIVLFVTSPMSGVTVEGTPSRLAGRCSRPA